MCEAGNQPFGKKSHLSFLTPLASSHHKQGSSVYFRMVACFVVELLVFYFDCDGLSSFAKPSLFVEKIDFVCVARFWRWMTIYASA